MSEEKFMPLHSDDRKRFPDVPVQIPMEILNEEQAERNHGQSLSRLAERGGMGCKELVANINKLSYHEVLITEEESAKALIEILKNRRVMSEESKYYTPEPEELHPGFKCEVKVMSIQKEWDKAVVVMDKLSGRLWIDTQGAGATTYDPAKIRCKLLDHSDILSAGWDRDITLSFQKPEITKAEFSGADVNKDYFLITARWKDRMIQIEDVDGIIFRGIIKNASELSRIMKQVGIN